MESVIIRKRTESICKALQAYMKSNLDDCITEENNFWGDGLTVETPADGNIIIANSEVGFALLDVGRFPAVFIEPKKKKPLNSGNENFSAHQLNITGFLRADAGTDMDILNLRFASAMEMLILSDLHVTMNTGGGLIGEIVYYPAVMRSDGWYSAFQIDISYLD